MQDHVLGATLKSGSFGWYVPLFLFASIRSRSLQKYKKHNKTFKLMCSTLSRDCQRQADKLTLYTNTALIEKKKSISELINYFSRGFWVKKIYFHPQKSGKCATSWLWLGWEGEEGASDFVARTIQNYHFIAVSSLTDGRL